MRGARTSESARAGAAARKPRLEKQEHRQTLLSAPSINAGGAELWVLIELHHYCCLFFFHLGLVREVCNVLPIKQIPTVSPGIEETAAFLFGFKC